MAEFPQILTLEQWIYAFGIAFAAGLIKGVVGFAMPMVIISGLAAMLSPTLALAGLIVPTLVTNGMQAFRLGGQSALEAMRVYRRFLWAGAITMLLGAQLINVIPARIYFLAIGVPITLFVVAQLLGWRLKSTKQSPSLDVSMGAITGVIGGISGAWSAPTVAYLTALNTPKQIQVQVQGVIYGLGAIVLLVAHIGSGVINKSTIWLSLGMTVPAILGMAAGTVIQDRIDQTLFRRATLLVLLLAGMNLIRRGLIV